MVRESLPLYPAPAISPRNPVPLGGRRRSQDRRDDLHPGDLVSGAVEGSSRGHRSSSHRVVIPAPRRSSAWAPEDRHVSSSVPQQHPGRPPRPDGRRSISQGRCQVLFFGGREILGKALRVREATSVRFRAGPCFFEERGRAPEGSKISLPSQGVPRVEGPVLCADSGVIHQRRPHRAVSCGSGQVQLEPKGQADTASRRNGALPHDEHRFLEPAASGPRSSSSSSSFLRPSSKLPSIHPIEPRLAPRPPIVWPRRLIRMTNMGRRKICRFSQGDDGNQSHRWEFEKTFYECRP